MAVLLKRSKGGVPGECPYGCCTDVYGRNVKHTRRRIKRAEKRNALRDARREVEDARLARVAEESNERARMQEDRYRESQKASLSA